MKHTISILMLAAVCLSGCSPAKPKVICVMQNPTNGARVELFKEIPYKVPADYDERKHIADWKAEQSRKGYTVEITK